MSRGPGAVVLAKLVRAAQAPFGEWGSAAANAIQQSWARRPSSSNVGSGPFEKPRQGAVTSRAEITVFFFRGTPHPSHRNARSRRPIGSMGAMASRAEARLLAKCRTQPIARASSFSGPTPGQEEAAKIGIDAGWAAEAGSGTGIEAATVAARKSPPKRG